MSCLLCTKQNKIFKSSHQFAKFYISFEIRQFWVNTNRSKSLKMPAENMEEQGLAKVPNLDLSQLKFEVAQGLGEQYINLTWKKQIKSNDEFCLYNFLNLLNQTEIRTNNWTFLILCNPQGPVLLDFSLFLTLLECGNVKSSVEIIG